MPNPDEMIIKSAMPNGSGSVLQVTPESAGWTYVGLTVEQIAAGDSWSYAAESDEICIVPLRGSAVITSNHCEWTVSRPGTMFDGKPTCLYLPVGSSFTATSEAGAELAVTASRATVSFPAKLIEPDDIDVEIRGAGNAARQISHIIKPEFPADNLLVVEVFTPSGNWSSFPPHKHDVSRMPEEAILEEIYYYRINPDDGFALQRLYFADGSFDHAWTIHDGDLLLVPEGYHAFAVAHGYTGYYLNILAGPEEVRTMQPADDPRYAWVRSTWSDDMNDGMASWQDIDDRVNGDAGKRK
ncbi:MAG: 5-deoxy-glucuronate isomerase [Thermomicrobiales bacterium]|nr:5-deoxy-glucuronate isomerase [Thermomicrobiales bacterium]